MQKPNRKLLVLSEIFLELLLTPSSDQKKLLVRQFFQYTVLTRQTKHSSVPVRVRCLCALC